MTSAQNYQLSVSPEAMRAAGVVHEGSAAVYQGYRELWRQWAEEVKTEVIRCHGTVAAPVAEALADHAVVIGEQVLAATAHHGAMGAKLVSAAAGYESVDEAGAASVTAVAV
jgi:hypothetical protein